jgi:ribosomal protein S4
MACMTRMSPQLFTPEQVAEMGYAKSRRMVQRLIREGRLIAVNTGTAQCPRYRVTAAELVRFAEANNTAA